MVAALVAVTSSLSVSVSRNFLMKLEEHTQSASLPLPDEHCRHSPQYADGTALESYRVTIPGQNNFLAFVTFIFRYS